MSKHGKDVMTQPEVDKTKWETKTTDALVDICEETLKSITRLPGAPVPKFEWDAVVSKFKARTGLLFTKRALKNKWDQLRKDWQLWTKMVGNETGLGWDNDYHRPMMDDEWWDLKIKENKDYAKFKKWGFRYRFQLDFCFGGSVATGSFCTGSSGGHKTTTNPIDVPLAETNWFEGSDGVYTPNPIYLESEHDTSTATSPMKKNLSTPPQTSVAATRAPAEKQSVSRKRKSAAQVVEDDSLTNRLVSAFEHVAYKAKQPATATGSPSLNSMRLL